MFRETEPCIHKVWRNGWLVLKIVFHDHLGKSKDRLRTRFKRILLTGI